MAHCGRPDNYGELPLTTLMRPSRLRQLALLAIGSRHAWYLNLVGLTCGKEQCRSCRRDLVKFRMSSRLDGFANLFLFLVE